MGTGVSENLRKKPTSSVNVPLSAGGKNRMKNINAFATKLKSDRFTEKKWRQFCILVRAG